MLLILFLLIPSFGHAQSEAKIQKKFLAKLNTILENSKEQHWNYSGKMSIDSAFAINNKGILSSTVRYSNESSFIKVRMAVPLNRIKAVLYDHYIILKTDGNEVQVSEFLGDQPEPTEIYQNYLFHIGVPPNDGFQEKEKLEKLLLQLNK